MKTTVLVIAALIITAVGFLAFTAGDGSYRNSRDIVYKVACEGCSIQYRDETGTSQTAKVKETWEYRFTADKGQFIYLAASSAAKNATVIIEQGNHLVKKQVGTTARAGFIIPE